jgi:hypothetical protein
MKSQQSLQDIARHNDSGHDENQTDRGHERPRIVALGDLGAVQNGYNGNNYDWSEWYYYDY